MKHPRFWRNVWIVAALLGAVAATIAFLMPDGGQGFTLQVVLGVGGLTLAPIATVIAIQTALEIRRFDRLDQGDAILARWTIVPAVWERFAFQNRSRQEAQSGAWRANFVSVPDTVNGPVEIVVSRDALRVGEEYHAVPRELVEGVDIMAGSPGCVEIYCATIAGETRRVRYILRFPVPSGRERDARAIAAHFTAPIRLGPIGRVLSAPARAADRNPRRARNIALVVAALGGLTGAALIAQADTPWVRRAMNDDTGAVLVMLGAVGGTIIALGALFLAAVWHAQSRSRV
jgi:hypothetical protein